MTTTAVPHEELAAGLRGDLITPGDARYDQARAVYNAMIDKHPAAIVRCRDVADVVACVRYGRAKGLDIGHAAAAGHHRRVLVDHGVIDGARLVVAGIAGNEHIAAEMASKVLCFGEIGHGTDGTDEAPHCHDPS